MASLKLPLGRKVSVKTSHKDNGGRRVRTLCISLKGRRGGAKAK
jgi:hypothetical protein